MNKLLGRFLGGFILNFIEMIPLAEIPTLMDLKLIHENFIVKTIYISPGRTILPIVLFRLGYSFQGISLKLIIKR